MRRLVVGLAVVVCVAALPSGPAGAADKPPSTAQLAAAQKRANQAAARLSKAQAALARADRQVRDLESRTASTQKVVDVLGSQVRQMAVQQYVQGNVGATWVGDGDPGQAARARAMLRFVSLGRTDAVESFQVAQADLEADQGALRERLAAQKAVVAALRKEEAKVSAELGRLAAAQRAYEAKIAAERAAAAKARRASRNGAPLPLVPGLLSILGSGEWICPVQGARAFSNDWGQPRSGGRRHEGNDIFASRGTPVVASVAGTVKGHNSSLGGISYYLSGDDGNTYFGTHLDRLSGASGRVAAGTVVGYVGSSGNASASSPHLHFEIHPRGGGPVNPFATLSKFC